MIKVYYLYSTIFYLTFLSACTSQGIVPKYYKSPAGKFNIELAQVIKIDSVNLVLLDWAIFEETNRLRERCGFKKLRFNRPLQEAAKLHTREMVKLDYFSHTSPVSGNQTLKQRVRKSGIRNGIAGENLAVHPLMKTRQVFLIKRATSTQATAGYAWKIEVSDYTYRRFAADLVNRWLLSSPHRFNILNNQFRFVGISCVLTQYEGMSAFYVTQNFSSYNY